MKQYKIDDGSIWDAGTLAKKLNCSKSCAGQRLRTSTDPNKIFAPIGEALKLKYTRKDYQLTEGNKVVFTGTTMDIAITYKVCESTVYSRLRKGYRDIKDVCKIPNNSKHSSAGRAMPATKTSDMIKSRNFFNTLDHLWMKQKPILKAG